MTTGICPDCMRVFKLTKSGKMVRHGMRGYALNMDFRQGFLGAGFKIKETKAACSGSGLLPMDL